MQIVIGLGFLDIPVDKIENSKIYLSDGSVVELPISVVTDSSPEEAKKKLKETIDKMFEQITQSL